MSERSRVEAQTMLDRYSRRGQLGDGDEENRRLREIGEEYSELAYRAGLHPMPGRDMERLVVDGSTPDDYDGSMDARAKINRADKYVGPSHASVLYHVCVADWSADAWGKMRGFRARSGIGLAFLVDALRLLANFWRG